MRILLVLGTSTGGVGRHVHTLAGALVAAGHTVVVACPAPVERQFGFAALGARVVPVPLRERPDPVRDLRVVATLRRLSRRAHVVHAHGLRAGALAALRGAGCVPLVVTLHNAAPSGRLTSGVYAGLERVVAHRADVVLGVSADLVARQRRLGARRSELAVVPAAREDAPGQAQRHASSTSRSATRSALGLGGDRAGAALVVAVARLAPQKGLPALLGAVGRLRDLDLAVVVAGEGPQRAALQARVEREHLPVRLLGARGDVPDLLAAADVVVSSAVWEGQPISLQEALRAGAPIVATDVGGTRAVVGDAAVLVPAGDDGALADGIRTLVTTPGKRAELSELATRRAGALPSVGDAMEAALLCYQEARTRSCARCARGSWHHDSPV